jgi:hypothetical protein
MVGLLSVRGIELVDLVYVYSVDVDRHVANMPMRWHRQDGSRADVA